MEGPDFLKSKYNFHNSDEVKSAADRTEARTGEEVHPNTTEQIQNYLDRFKEIIEITDPEKRELGMEALKHLMYKSFVIKEGEIPESYFENQKRLAKERGHGDIEIGEDQKTELAGVIITDQKFSLDKWIDYLASTDATYPDWLKYYAFRSITSMGEYDKEKHQFTKRSNGTTKPFPDLNREALAYVLDAIEKKHKGTRERIYGPLEKDDYEFEKLLQGENFAKLYAWAIDKCTPASKEALADTRGEWIKYNRGSDHMPLVESLQGHGTGWCTAGESTAQAQLKNGDFYVYYSFDTDGNPTVPRVAIRMEGNSIAEVRGIAPDQNMDSFIAPVVQEKMKEFPDGGKYEKKSKDMEILTDIDNRFKKGQELSKEDLRFLYEMDHRIEGFGYQKDPRIEELRKQRNLKEDLPIVFECTSKQIAYRKEDLNENTEVYIGEWTPEVLKFLPESCTHIYERFPYKKVFLRTIETDPSIKSPKDAARALWGRGHRILSYGLDNLNEISFSGEKKSFKLVSFSVDSLGFHNGATVGEIFDKAKELGLELSPAEIAPQIRLQYEDQPVGEWLLLAMEPIIDSNGHWRVFHFTRFLDGTVIDVSGASPKYICLSDADFIFLRK